MINGVHGIIFSKDADALRAFFRDVLGFQSVDAGGGWLIFALPPAELGIHPAEDNDAGRQELYLMCDDIEATMADLKTRGVEFAGPAQNAGFGTMATINLPGGGQLALYEPRHPKAIP
jgi:catechol 2,3-dioxygenase-like lactoylglutathione lyase family enzyme